jgi:kumamolisin
MAKEPRLSKASESDVEIVWEFAAHHGLKVTRSDAMQRIVRLAGARDAMEKAFGVSLAYVTDGRSVYRVRSGHILLPQELDRIVLGVFGLDNRKQARPHIRLAPGGTSKSVKPQAFDGQQLSKIYNFPPGQGAGRTIGLIELGGGFQQSDLDTFFSSLGLSSPSVKFVSVLGGANSPGQDQDADTEVALDIEVAGAVAPSATIVVYLAPNTDQGFLEAISAAIHDDANHPDVISISWGAAEIDWTGQMLSAMDSLFESASSLGISVFVAAGDDGANDNVGDGKAHVDFPASSSWVTACGGTTMTVVNGVRLETTWNSSTLGGGATGGGISDVFARPSYQQNTKMPVNQSGDVQGRGLPDVAAVADPYTGYAVFVDGSWTVIGGTSAVAPLFSGLAALIDDQLSRRCGSINLPLYAAASDDKFHNIVTGNNSVDGVTGYTAGTGWNAVTGWGSPDGINLLQLFSTPT